MSCEEDVPEGHVSVAPETEAGRVPPEPEEHQAPGTANDVPPQSSPAEPNPIDDVLAAATRPDIWSKDILQVYNADRTQDCHVSLSIQGVTFPAPTLGQLQGLTGAQAAIDQVDRLMIDIVNIYRAQLPAELNQRLDVVFGPYIPPDTLVPPHLMPIPSAILTERLFAMFTAILSIPTSFLTTPATSPSPRFSPGTATLKINVNQDIDISLQVFSQMSSTYTFGRGSGTSVGSAQPSPPKPQITASFDHPWFAKALIPEAIMPLATGHPYPMPRAAGHWVAQLGSAGSKPAVHAGQLQLRSISQGAWIPIKLNGNYGRIRAIVIPPMPCKAIMQDLVISGPYEDDLARQEEARFVAVERRRDSMNQSLSSLQSGLGVLGSATGVVPVFGSLVDTLLSAAAHLAEQKKASLTANLDSANSVQRSINLTLAETYPERAPAGGREDDDLP